MKDKDNFLIAQVYQKGQKDYQLAKQYYQKAIKKGSAAAMNNLAILHAYHFKNIDKASDLYKRAIELNNPQASYNLALLYKDNYQDIEQASHYYQKAIELQDPDAMFNLANIYNQDLKNIDLAIKYYKMAGELGHMKAMTNLAFIYLEQEKDYSESENYFKRSLETGLLYNEDFLHISQNNPLNFHLLFLLAREAYDFLYASFNNDQASALQIKDRLKPFYYCLLQMMPNKRGDEHLRMGEELNETVQEINLQVELMREIYSD